jgi:hypothetical protein
MCCECDDNDSCTHRYWCAQQLTHFLDGWIEDVAIETSNLSVEKKIVSTFQMEGVQIYTLLTIAHRVLIDPQITSFKSFNMFHCLKD